ncbi:hypothetical protein GEV43_16960 [Actinomadura sp. J1-007]|nr:hypothetical protein [Actinomadura sp. J1-007]
MSSNEVLSLVLLLAVFVLAIWRDVNVGLVALPAAFLLAGIAGIPKAEVLAGFPADIVVLIIGVMYMFGHAQRSGAIDRMVHAVVAASGGRDWALPWVMFLVGAVLSGIGTLPSATVAIVLPIAMRLARNRGIDPVLMALVACSGAGVGGFSPLSPWAAIVRSLADRQGADYSPGMLFVGLAALKFAVTVIAFFALGGGRLARRTTLEPAQEPESVPAPASAHGSVPAPRPRPCPSPVPPPRPSPCAGVLRKLGERGRGFRRFGGGAGHRVPGRVAGRAGGLRRRRARVRDERRVRGAGRRARAARGVPAGHPAGGRRPAVGRGGADRGHPGLRRRPRTGRDAEDARPASRRDRRHAAHRPRDRLPGGVLRDDRVLDGRGAGPDRPAGGDGAAAPDVRAVHRAAGGRLRDDRRGRDQPAAPRRRAGARQHPRGGHAPRVPLDARLVGRRGRAAPRRAAPRPAGGGDLSAKAPARAPTRAGTRRQRRNTLHISNIVGGVRIPS